MFVHAIYIGSCYCILIEVIMTNNFRGNNYLNLFGIDDNNNQ